MVLQKAETKAKMKVLVFYWDLTTQGSRIVGKEARNGVKQCHVLFSIAALDTASTCVTKDTVAWLLSGLLIPNVGLL